MPHHNCRNLKGIRTKGNEAYGVSMATVPGRPQTGLQDYTQMSRNPCYATTQHIEIVGNECYSCVAESQQIDSDYNYITY